MQKRWLVKAKDKDQDEGNMQARHIDLGNGWIVEERIIDTVGKRRYFFNRRLGIRKPIETRIAKQACGYQLIAKDLRNLRRWATLLIKHTQPIAESEFHPSDDHSHLLRGTFLALIATYGKMFTEAKGRGVQLSHKEWIPDAHRKTHDFLMHQRHTLVAHSGSDSFETCKLVMLIDSSPKDRVRAVTYFEIDQPGGLGQSEMIKVDALLQHIENSILRKLESLVARIHSESVDTLSDEDLSRLRKSVKKTLLLGLNQKPQPRSTPRK